MGLLHTEAQLEVEAAQHTVVLPHENAWTNMLSQIVAQLIHPSRNTKLQFLAYVQALDGVVSYCIVSNHPQMNRDWLRTIQVTRMKRLEGMRYDKLGAQRRHRGYDER